MPQTKRRKSTKSVLRTMSKMERNIWNRIKLFPIFQKLNREEQKRIGHFYIDWIREEISAFFESINYKVFPLVFPPPPTEDYYFTTFSRLIPGLINKIREKTLTKKEMFIKTIEKMTEKEFSDFIKEIKERELFIDKLEKNVEFTIGGLQAFEKFLQDSLKL